MLIGVLSAFLEKEAMTFVEILLNKQENEFQFAVSTSERQTRPLRRCLIPIENGIIACPVGVLQFACLGLYIDITEGTIKEEGVKKELSEIRKKLNLEFEEFVANYLRSKFPEAIVKHNIEMKGIPKLNSKEFVQFKKLKKRSKR